MLLSIVLIYVSHPDVAVKLNDLTAAMSRT